MKAADVDGEAGRRSVAAGEVLGEAGSGFAAGGGSYHGALESLAAHLRSRQGMSRAWL
jgi:hypothetical protein